MTYGNFSKEFQGLEEAYYSLKNDIDPDYHSDFLAARVYYKLVNVLIPEARKILSQKTV